MPEAKGTSADLCVHSLTPDIALLVWEDRASGLRGKQPRATVGGRPARPPFSFVSVALDSLRRRNIMVLCADAAAVRHERICIAEADGPVVAIADSVDDPAGRPIAFTPADLIAGVDAAGRLRIARLMLEIAPGIFRLGDSPAFAAACLHLAAALAPTPPALLPCSRLFGSYGLFTGTADTALGGKLNAVVVSGGRVRRVPFAPAVAPDMREGAPGGLFLALRDTEAGHPDAIVVIFSDRGMICRRISTSERPLPSAIALFQGSGSAKAGPTIHRYVLDCLAHLGRQDAQAAALLRKLQAMAPSFAGGSVPASTAARSDLIVASSAGSFQVIDIGCVPQIPDAAVIGPVPEDPLLMRCRAGLFAADPEMRTVEVLYLLDRAQDQQKIAQFLRDVHAAYGIAARLVVIPHAGTAAAALNAGVQVSRAPVLVSLGGAVLPEHPAWLSTLTRHLKRHATVGIVAARLLREDHTLWNDGIDIGSDRDRDVWDLRPICTGFPRRLATASMARQVAAVSPGCIAIPRSVLERCGGFSRRYLSFDYSVADLCLTAAAAGFKTCLTSEATLLRLDPLGDECSGREALDPRAEVDRRLLERRWRSRLEAVAHACGGRAA